MTTNTPAEYRSKPVTIEAVQYDGTAESRTAIIDWINTHGGSARIMMLAGEPTDTPTYSIRIESIEGPVEAFVGWWIIRGTAGEFYPCRDDVFQTKYAAVAVQPMRELPIIFGTTRENRGPAAIELSRPESNAVAQVLAAHEAELVAALEPFGIDWRTVVMPAWERFLTATDIRTTLEAHDRTAGK